MVQSSGTNFASATPSVGLRLFGELGVPDSAHKVRFDLGKLCPLNWTAPNCVFMKKPRAILATCLAYTDPAAGTSPRLCSRRRLRAPPRA
jgi:hypothetical protein